MRPYVLEIQNCENIFFEDLTVLESPFHTFNFSGVERLVVRGITLRNDPKSPNTDGLHLFACKYVRVSEVDFDTCDDCILTGGGTTDVVVTNSRFKTPWGLFWPIDGKRITISNCVVTCQMLVKDIRKGEDITLSNIVANGPGKLFSTYQGEIKNLTLNNIQASDWSQGGWLVNGENIILNNIQIRRKPGAGDGILQNGLDFKNTKGLTLKDVTIDNVEIGSALRLENVTDLELDGFKSSGVPADSPDINLINVRGAYIHESRGKPNTTFAHVYGKLTQDIRYAGNDLNGARIEVNSDVALSAIKTIRATVSGFEIPDAVEVNKHYLVQASVHSEDFVPGLFPISLKVDGVTEAIRWLWLEAGETKTESIIGPKLFASRTYRIALNDLPPRSVKLKPLPANFEVVSANLPRWNRILKSGSQGLITASIQNTGSYSGSHKLTLTAGNEALFQKTLTLKAGEVSIEEIPFKISKPGIHTLDLDGQWTATSKVYTEALDSQFLNYTFDDIDGDLLADESGLDHVALLKSNPNGSVPLQVDGIIGKALKFNGESAFVEIPQLLLKFPMTLSLWVKSGELTPSSTAGRQMILYASIPNGNDGYGPEPEIHLMRATGETFSFWTNEADQRLDIRYPIEDKNAWTHLTVVYDEISRLYINGQEVTSQSGIKPPTIDDYADRIYIGRPNVDYLRYFNGAIDELQFFNEALTTKQVASLFEEYCK